MLSLELAGDIPLFPVSLFNILYLAREVFVVVSTHAMLRYFLLFVGLLPIIGSIAS